MDEPSIGWGMEGATHHQNKQGDNGTKFFSANSFAAIIGGGGSHGGSDGFNYLVLVYIKI